MQFSLRDEQGKYYAGHGCEDVQTCLCCINFRCEVAAAAAVGAAAALSMAASMSSGLPAWKLSCTDTLCLHEQVIDDVANMGFSRHEVKGVVLDLMDKGQSVDLNIVLDRLMHGRR